MLNIIDEHYSEIETTAAEVGIDFSKSRHLVLFDDKWKNNVPAIEKVNAGKLSIISSIKADTYTITFRTLKDGGRNASWSTKSNDKFYNPPRKDRVASLNSFNKEKQKTKTIYDRYISAWKESTQSAPKNFPYFIKKGVSDPSLKLVRMAWGEEFVAIPMYKEGKIVGLQRISSDRKSFIKGTKSSGAYFPIGEVLNDRKVWLAEGWATGQTIHNITSDPVVVCFSVSGIEENLKNLLNKGFDYKNIFIAADNDHLHSSQKVEKTKNGNAGLLTALKINKEYGIKVRYPNFDRLPEKKGLSDFNDIYCKYGAKETLVQLTRHKTSILKSKEKKLDYLGQKLALETKKTSPKNPVIQEYIQESLKNFIPINDIVDNLNQFNSVDIDKKVLTTFCQKIKKYDEYRVSNLHTIKKGQRYVRDARLNLNKREGGGFIIDSSILDEINDKEGIFIIKAPMGSGKTESIIKPLMEKSENAFYFAHRQSLVDEACSRIKIPSYNKMCDIESSVSRKFGCCVNSVTKERFYRGDVFKGADLVAIDEVTKVFSHLTGSTIEDHKTLTPAFFDVIRSAKQVVMTDADANNLLVDICKKHFPEQKITVLQADNCPMGHVHIEMDKMEAMFGRTLEAIENKENILVACDTKVMAQKIKNICLEKKVTCLDIWKETKPTKSVEYWIDNPNKESEKYQVIVYNSSIDSGVSLVTDHFDRTFGLFRNVLSPDAVIQMMGRNRTSKKWELGVSPISEFIFRDLIKHKKDALKAESLKIQLTSADNIPELDEHSLLELEISDHDKKCRNNYTLTLKTMLEQKGYSVSVDHMEKNLLKKHRKHISELGKAIELEFINRVLKVNSPSDLEVRILDKKVALTEEERAQLFRHTIHQNLGVSEINEAVIKFWMFDANNINNFELLYNTDEKKSKAFDKFEHKHIAATKRKHIATSSQLLNSMFEILGINKKTGKMLSKKAKGFTHKECQIFYDYLSNNSHLRTLWNMHGLGKKVNCDKPVKDPVKFVLEALKRMGLEDTKCQKTKRRLSHHQIKESSWAKMLQFAKNREVLNIHVTSFECKDSTEDTYCTYEAQAVNSPPI